MPTLTPRKCVVLLAGILMLFLTTQPASAVIRDGGIDPANLGKGDWIYFMSAATNKLGGNVASVTNETSLMLFYKSQGIRYIIIKAATSDVLFNGSYAVPQFNSNLVNIAHANGILIFGYNRSFGENIPAEIAIADYVFNQGADGFVYDAEGEWENFNAWIGTSGPAKAWQLCSTVRSNWPTKFIAHAPFPIISWHTSFPYKEFGYWCDTAMPQIYPANWTGVKSRPSGGINWTDVNWYEWQNSLIGQSTNVNGVTHYWTNAIKPIAPVNHVYGPNPPNAGVSEIPANFVEDFMDYLIADPHTQTAGGYKGANFWRADLHGVSQWTYIKNGTSGDFQELVSNIVIDDPTATVVGGWDFIRTFYNGTNFGNGSGTDHDSFGTNYLFKAKGFGTDYVQFTPAIISPGDYDVYVRYPTFTNASASVPFVVTHSGGVTNVSVNQQLNPGVWNKIGRFNFAAGTSGNVRVTDGIPEADKAALVDGLKLVFVSPTGSPLITAQPQDQSVVINQDATFTVRVVPGPAPTYQWKFNGTNIPGATGSSFTRTSVVTANAGNYSVLLSNAFGTVLSSTAALTVSTNVIPPGIATQPQSQAAAVGQAVSFGVIATGTAPFYYQWRFNGSQISGATASGYTRGNIQMSDAGNFDVIITNSAGAVTSAPAVLTVQFSLTALAGVGGTVSLNPAQSSYASNSLATITATPIPGWRFAAWSGSASGSSNPLTVTMTANKTINAIFVEDIVETIIDNTNATFNGVWQSGNSAAGKYGPDYRFAITISGAAMSNVVFRPLLSAGVYDVYVWHTTGGNRSTSVPCRITYDGGITNLFINQQLNNGTWVRIASSLNFAGGTNGNVTLFNNTIDPGKVVIADAVRFVNILPPSITASPQNLSVKVSSNATFTVSVGGTAPFSYQWKWNGGDLAGATSNTLALVNVQTNQAGTYSVMVSNPAGTINSSNALLTILLPQPIQIENISKTTNGQVELLVTGEPGSSYFIQNSSNLLDWVSITNVVNTNGSLRVLDSSATNKPLHFYRARLAP